MSLYDRVSGVRQLGEDVEAPEFKKIPRGTFDLACPYCEQVMGEKNFSFKFDAKTGLWEHCGKPIRPTTEQREDTERWRKIVKRCPA